MISIDKLKSTETCPLLDLVVRMNDVQSEKGIVKQDKKRLICVDVRQLKRHPSPDCSESRPDYRSGSENNSEQSFKIHQYGQTSQPDHRQEAIPCGIEIVCGACC